MIAKCTVANTTKTTTRKEPRRSEQEQEQDDGCSIRCPFFIGHSFKCHVHSHHV